MTGAMLAGIEEVLLEEKPDWVLVYGDTNSTMAGALAAVKLGIQIAHVESGVRMGTLSNPEEVNRVVTDHISQLLFTPTEIEVENLKKRESKNTFTLWEILCMIPSFMEAEFRGRGRKQKFLICAEIQS